MSYARFFVVLRDETGDWYDEGLVDRCGGKISGAYFFDANRHTHCGELTPSYALHFLTSVPQGAISEEDHHMLLYADIDNPWISYIHVHDIDFDKCIFWGSYTEDEWEDILDNYDDSDGCGEEEAYEELLEEVRESISANPVY